jgi:hypothetical protein
VYTFDGVCALVLSSLTRFLSPGRHQGARAPCPLCVGEKEWRGWPLKHRKGTANSSRWGNPVLVVDPKGLERGLPWRWRCFSASSILLEPVSGVRIGKSLYVGCPQNWLSTQFRRLPAESSRGSLLANRRLCSLPLSYVGCHALSCPQGWQRADDTENLWISSAGMYTYKFAILCVILFRLMKTLMHALRVSAARQGSSLERTAGPPSEVLLAAPKMRCLYF